MAEYWPRSFLCGLWLLVGPQTRNKIELGQYPAILTWQAWPWSVTHMNYLKTKVKHLQGFGSNNNAV